MLVEEKLKYFSCQVNAFYKSGDRTVKDQILCAVLETQASSDVFPLRPQHAAGRGGNASLLQLCR